jgi:vacuolar-type H+-ATPase subunit F/Vma7
VQSVADAIRDVIDAYDAPIPAVLEIPSADGRYDVHRDGILRHAGLVAVSDYVPEE